MTNELPTWKNTFNASLKLHGYIDRAIRAAIEAGYPFIAWNGWVYESNLENWSDETRIMLVEDLK